MHIIWRHLSRRFYRRVTQLAKSNDFDLVWLDNLPIAYCYQKNLQIPQVLTDHDVSYVKCKRMSEQKSNILAKLFYAYEAFKLKYFERKTIGQVDLCIAVSEDDKASLNFKI